MQKIMQYVTANNINVWEVMGRNYCVARGQLPLKLWSCHSKQPVGIYLIMRIFEIFKNSYTITLKF